MTKLNISEYLPNAASSVELPRPITAVEMRLINGPQIHNPVAGPENIIISLICFQKLLPANSFLLDLTTSTFSYSRSDPETKASLPPYSLTFPSSSSVTSEAEPAVHAVLNWLKCWLVRYEMRKLGGERGKGREKYGGFLKINEEINFFLRNGFWRGVVGEERAMDLICIFSCFFCWMEAC